MSDRDLGEGICTHLRTLGLTPVWLEAIDGQIAIGIEFISAAPNWVRAFRHDATYATPGAFVRLINEWKNSVRRQIVQNDCSTVVAKAIQAHGIMAVLDAMEDTPMGVIA